MRRESCCRWFPWPTVMLVGSVACGGALLLVLPAADAVAFVTGPISPTAAPTGDAPTFPTVQSLWKELIGTAILVVTLFAIRMLVAHLLVRRGQLTGEDRRRVMVSIRNATLLIGVLGMMMIWARELQTLALSIFAIAAALVLATKELILCISGSMMRTKSFSVGDRIEINGFRGDVIDKNILSTRVLEIGPDHSAHQYTGRVLVIPNSMFLSNPVCNESALGKYSLHVFVVPLKIEDDWQQAERILLAAATTACKDFLRAAGEHWKQAEQEYGHYTPTAEPRISVHLPEPGKIHLLVRVPVPKGRKQKVEQQIIRQFVSEFKPAPHPPDKAAVSARLPVSPTTPFIAG